MNGRLAVSDGHSSILALAGGLVSTCARFRTQRKPQRDVVEGMLGTVNSRRGRIAFITIGVIAVIIGGVFAGQGVNLIPGSFMTGSRMWLSIGLIVAAVGIILVVLGLRRPGPGRPSK